MSRRRVAVARGARRRHAIWCLLVLGMALPPAALAQPRPPWRWPAAAVQVDAAIPGGSVNPLLLGHNMTWTTADNTADAAGTGRPHSNVVKLLVPLRIPSVRFPGGLMANCYDWSAGVTHYDAGGRPLPRPANLVYDFATFQCKQGPVAHFGTDELMRELSALNAEGPQAVITVNVCSKDPNPPPGTRACSPVSASPAGPPTGTAICPDPGAGDCPGASDAANWVTYLNGTDPTNPLVQLRARNGHPDPYNIRYFELGNEVHHFNVDGDVYRRIIAAYVPQMRAASPIPIRIGAVANESWDTAVASDGLVDFLAPHLYGPETDKYTARLQAAPRSARSQSWPIQVPADGAPFQFQAAVYPDCPHVKVYIDSKELPFVGRTPARQGGGGGGHCAWDAGAASAGRRVLTLQTTHSYEAHASLAALCATGSTVSSCRDPVAVDLGPYIDNPEAIAVLRPPGSPAVASLTRSLEPVPGERFSVDGRAFGSPTFTTDAEGRRAPECPTLVISAGHQVRRVPLGSGPPSEPCFSFLRPKAFRVSFDPSPDVRSVTFAFEAGPGGADANLIDAKVGDQVLNLDPYSERVPPRSGALRDRLRFARDERLVPQLADAQSYSAALTNGQHLDGLRARIAASTHPDVGIMVSEWAARPTLNSPAGAAEPDTVRAMLQDVLMLQQMITRNVEAANYWTLNGALWHVFRCLGTTQFDYPGACGHRDAAPYLSVPGQMFAVLGERLGSSWVRTTVNGPSVVVPANVAADFRVLQPSQTLPVVSALATVSPGWVHLQLVNLSPADPGLVVTVKLDNAALSGAPASLVSISGDPDHLNGCQVAVAAPCTPSAVTTRTTDVAAKATMGLTLPPNSFSVLSVPVAAAAAAELDVPGGGRGVTQGAAPFRRRSAQPLRSRPADEESSRPPGPQPPHRGPSGFGARIGPVTAHISAGDGVSATIELSPTTGGVLRR